MNEAYKQVHVAYNAALDYFSNKDEDANWIIPVVVSISNDLRLIAGLVSASAHNVNAYPTPSCDIHINLIFIFTSVMFHDFPHLG